MGVSHSQTAVVGPFDRGFGSFHGHGATPLSLDGLFHGKAENRMDDLVLFVLD